LIRSSLSFENKQKEKVSHPALLSLGRVFSPGRFVSSLWSDLGSALYLLFDPDEQ
jgi:hypothetical protein